jgi:hypothetical protein
MTARDAPIVEYRAVVTSVEPGPHGRYAFAKCEGIRGLVTFSLKSRNEDGAWDETREPSNGDVVILSEVRLRKAGWRAFSARFVTPQDREAKHE